MPDAFVYFIDRAGVSKKLGATHAIEKAVD